ncbi:MAG: hypothetical protein GTO45_35625 [Candidatus Aminicenantes bacterium]|nr:hypothetical protein [Candidatus Aminicenantes bacterium]NIM84007.1 hypothetical protein [Candidatus Aminicenantes bacterium]NIN23485.1 hypothetical protein [Candidatus Aminicenantes bacterium]NIN47190.1 hypothetical protein [Candidatus Aminicenantes bacterium]NIN90114.1 hypothetical protein [Candidatus Aminicenantes bacterium]
MEQRDISAEKKKVKRFFVSRSLIIIVFLVLYCFFASLYVFNSEHPLWDEKVQANILLFLPAVLVAITARIFAIPEAAGIKEYPGFNRKIKAMYLSWLALNIIFPFLPLIGIIPLTVTVFKLCIVLFVTSLIILTAYVLIVHSKIYNVLIRIFNFSVFQFIRGSRNTNNKTPDRINKMVYYMRRLIIHSIHEHDDRTFYTGLNKIDALGKTILDVPDLDLKFLNSFFKNTIVNYRHIAAECIKSRLEDYLRDTFSKIAGLIKYGIDFTNKNTAEIDYPIAVIELSKVGMMSLENNMHSIGSDIIDSLEQIGNKSLGGNLDHPPTMEVLRALQEIGEECARRKLENLCLEALIKIEWLGVEAQDKSESVSDLKRKEDLKKVFQNALKSHWIVSAFLFKSIPETKEGLRDAKARLEDVFNNDYLDAYDQALKEMDLMSYVGKKILMDYKKVITRRGRLPRIKAN